MGPRSRTERIRREHFMRQIKLFVDSMAKKVGRDWDKLVPALKDQGWPEEQINDFVLKANKTGLRLSDYFKNAPSKVTHPKNPSKLKRAGRVRVAGIKSRALATPAVDQRLAVIRDIEKRSRLALHLAETCYECFSVEDLFRELLDCDPADDNRIQTVLVDLEIQLDHIKWHIRELKGPLKEIIKALDSRRTEQNDMDWKELATRLLGKPGRPPR